MHLSMHNWMRAEPLEVTVAAWPNMATRASKSRASRTKYNTKDVRKLLKEYNLRCWGSVT
jgi:D-psicose/D-tagatose/L-ribulose 3-epimerase